MTILNKIDNIILCGRLPISFNNIEEAITNINKLFNGNYSQAYDKFKNKIYFDRYTQTDYPIYVIDRLDQKERVSANTYNTYNIIFSKYLDSWSEFPKRNKSVIMSMSNSFDIRNKANDSYLVFPVNNSDFGICPARDLWFSFTHPEIDNIGGLDIIDFSEAVNSIMVQENINIEDFLYNRWDINKMNNSNGFNSDLIKKFTSSYLKSNHKSIIEFLDDVLNPEKHGFKLKTLNDIEQPTEGKLEVWTADKCLLIKTKFIDEIFNYTETNNITNPFIV